MKGSLGGVVQVSEYSPTLLVSRRFYLFFVFVSPLTLPQVFSSSLGVPPPPRCLGDS